MKLLLILNNADDAAFLNSALGGQAVKAIEIVHVTDLAGAMTALREQQFDVMLLDLQLPDGDGLECIDAVKNVDNDTPIVVLSAQDDEDLAISILNRGAQDYLVKWEGHGRTILRSIRHSIERKRSEMRLSYLAQYDPLTGAPNRQFFNEHLQRATANALRNSRSVSLLFIDLDDFKIVNDTLGHDVGDALLKEIADRLLRSVRANDVVARLGGDEFAVVIEGPGDAKEIEAVANGLLGVVSQPYQIAERHIEMTASIGISVFPSDHSDTQMLMKHADIAMYRAKDGAGNRYKFFHEKMQDDLLAYHELSRGIKDGLDKEEFHLAFQPKVNVHTRLLQGMEALLRWTRPGQGDIGPAEFIPVAEESGLIIPLGDWVLEKVCETLNEWTKRGLRVVPVSVNVSARQFQQPQFHKRVAEILERHDIPPELIELELTEGLVMADVESTQSEIANLKRMGLRISIDDFGTGYSCLNYLRKFPIDILKIDQSFVHDIGINADGEAIIDAIISLGRSLRLETVAEGVETPEQLDYLVEHGCHIVQGYLLGVPMPEKSIEKLLIAIEDGDTDSTAVVRALTCTA